MARAGLPLGGSRAAFTWRGALVALATCPWLAATTPARADAARAEVRSDEGARPVQASVSLLPTQTAPACETCESTPRRGPGNEALLVPTAQKLDALLSDGVEDLGFTLALADRTRAGAPAMSDDEILVRAGQEQGRAWLIAPRIEAKGQELLVRIAAVAPGSNVVMVRTEWVKPGELAVRAVVMLRDLLAGRENGGAHGGGGRATGPGGEEHGPSASGPLAIRARSQGRATLALNAALFGGFVGYSIQRASGSQDPRLLYPLMALGTGVGLGASMIVAEEWDVGIGDAWYLAAGAWWPAAAGILIARGRGAALDDAFAYGMLGAGAGVGLATLSLTFGGMTEGQALLTHSGGAFGTVLGGMTELAIRGSTDAFTPNTGLGVGAATGVLLAGALATQIAPEASRVSLIDLGAGLGGLAGAAAASPFLFGERTVGRERAFLVTTMATTVAGGAFAWFLTRPHSADPPPKTAAASWGAPFAGLIGESEARNGTRIPAWGVGWSGTAP